jgi:hypothetical protein
MSLWLLAMIQKPDTDVLLQLLLVEQKWFTLELK